MLGVGSGYGRDTLIYFISAAYALGENKFARGLPERCLGGTLLLHYTALHAASVLIVWLALILDSATLANYFKKRAARVKVVSFSFARLIPPSSALFLPRR